MRVPVPSRAAASLFVLPLALALLAPEAGAQIEKAPILKRNTWYRDVSLQAGVLFDHDDSDGNYTIGSGSAWFDMDQDGDEDLLVQNSTGPSALYRRDGNTFVDVYVGSGLVDSPDNQSFGLALGDYNADGLEDVYFTNINRNTFFVNLGGGKFDERAIELGLHAGHDWSTSASWADFDLDGDLDLYVGNYVDQLNFPHHYGAPNRLLENVGPTGEKWFDEVAGPLGVDDTGLFGPSLPGFSYVSPEGELTGGCTLSTGTLDYDEDGDPDIQVGNDFGQWVLPNALFRNDQSGGSMAFTDVSAATGFDTRPHYNMGVFPADFDHDGDWDFYNTNIGDNLLLRNEGGVWVDGTYDAGPTSGSVPRAFTIQKVSSWGCLFEDLDNDSFEDIYVVNGFIPAAWFIDNAERAPNHVWMNNGDGTFYKVPEDESGAADEGPGRSVAKADVNGDGLLDFYVQNNGSIYTSNGQDRSRLFMNSGLNRKGHAIEIDLAARIGHPDAYGARLDLTVNGTVLKRQRLGDSPFLAASSRMAHFGVGMAPEAELLTIHWPSGIVQTLRGIASAQRITILEPAVTGEGFPSVSYAGGSLTLSVVTRNHDSIDHHVDVLFELRRASDDTLLYSAPAASNVGAGQQRLVTTSIPIDPAVYAGLAGTDVELHAQVSAAGSDDQDVDAQTLP